ncbi:uncharacterized protein LOC8066411 isoform X2 [Sorghum bicolor]|uniref:uncharacterized protein LOC8066411 isoform X2 n=1 Tax=Sorghum bicolor TaxID=4558 RepID=UPI0007F1D293|nr:uncharacterized protein LOC8066411 isoform X2 [Sorghum bicolor]|eukprot:XP_021313933.1 uncharacterized protein LOC8066411 isoform X2 [Sorghum bicolor]
MGQVPPPTGACTEDEEDVVVAADAIATPAPDAGDPELAVQQRKGKRKKKKRRRRRKRPTEQEVAARRSVLRWACPGREAVGDHEAGDVGRRRPRVAVELHAHSAFSDGSLSPADLVERAHRNGVKVLALTDHDTMAGVPEAVEAAKQYPIRIIPGVEISAVHSPSGDEMSAEEPVHILAYYGAWGPAKPQELERFLAIIRDGRYARAKQMLQKLKDLGMPMKLEDVCKIAGNGVAPGRLHVARAMVDAGYVENLRQAFSRYLFDGGPAYATEPNGKSVVQLVCRTGGVAVLAHPWALKNPAAVVKDLKAAGLHGIEVYRSDGKVSGLSDLADTYNLLKLGGSDFHGRDDKEEPDVGSVDLPVLAVLNFLEVAKPIWHNAIREMFASISKRTTDLNGSKRLRRASSAGNFCILCLSSEDQGLTHAP